MTPLSRLPWRREYRKCGIRGGRTQGLWARGLASQVLTGKKLAGPNWAELWQRHLRVQQALGMESPVAAAGVRGTEAVAGEGPVIGGASQGSAVSVPKGVARWKLLRQVRATARHRCLWPLPSQVPGARAALSPGTRLPTLSGANREASTCFTHCPTEKGRIWRGWLQAGQF